MPIQNYPTVFDCTEMTAAVNKLPALPVYFRRLFEVKGVKTTTVSLDIRKGRIVLIGDSERNTAPESLAGRGAKREWMPLCAHRHVRHAGARRPSGRAGVRFHRADFGCRSL
ncbi:MAG: major capsid protein [Bilophila wadsworthia]